MDFTETRPKRGQCGSAVVVDFLGQKGAGKTTQCKRMAAAFTELGIRTTHIDQDGMKAKATSAFLREVRGYLQEGEKNTDQRQRIRDHYIAALRTGMFQAQQASEGIFLVEHGVHQTAAMERALRTGTLSDDQLMSLFSGIPMGNVGIFLDISSKDVQASGRLEKRNSSNRRLHDPSMADQIEREMRRMVDLTPDRWIRIDARKSEKEVFDLIMPQLCYRIRTLFEGKFNQLPVFPIEKMGGGGTA
jgi:thymidylate kinase